MTEVIHITENAGEPSARVSAISPSDLGTLIGISLPAADPLEVNALWNDNGVLSVSPKPLAVADFKNGVYLLNGAPAVLADLLVSPRYYTLITEPTITAGVGWNNVGAGGATIQQKGYSASDALLTLMDLTGEGCSMVVDFVAVNPGSGGCALSMPIGDYPNWALGWSVGITVESTRFETFISDFFNADQFEFEQPPAQGKAVFNLSYELVASVVNGGTVAELNPPSASSLWADPSFLDIICNVQDVGSQILIRSIKWYPPQGDVTDLQLLSV